MGASTIEYSMTWNAFVYELDLYVCVSMDMYVLWPRLKNCIVKSWSFVFDHLYCLHLMYFPDAIRTEFELNSLFLVIHLCSISFHPFHKERAFHSSFSLPVHSPNVYFFASVLLYSSYILRRRAVVILVFRLDNGKENLQSSHEMNPNGSIEATNSTMYSMEYY